MARGSPPRSQKLPLAVADFGPLPGRLTRAGYQVREPAPGILEVRHLQKDVSRVLLSIGIHGDETAPVELLAGILDNVGAVPNALAVDLMVIVGNPAAIAAGKRYLGRDLNRMFRTERGRPEVQPEASRADEIMRAARGFLDSDKRHTRWHLDLHSAIRRSRYANFAVVPALPACEHATPLFSWLGHAGIGAVVLSPPGAGTFSAWTASTFGTWSATLELGQVTPFGTSNLAQFEETRLALTAMLRGALFAGPAATPHRFRVVRELIKGSDAFRPAFSPEVENFAAFAPGSAIAADGEQIFRTGEQTEYILFPNPAVDVGMRAALLAVREEGG